MNRRGYDVVVMAIALVALLAFGVWRRSSENSPPASGSAMETSDRIHHGQIGWEFARQVAGLVRDENALFGADQGQGNAQFTVESRECFLRGAALVASVEFIETSTDMHFSIMCMSPSVFDAELGRLSLILMGKTVLAMRHGQDHWVVLSGQYEVSPEGDFMEIPNSEQRARWAVAFSKLDGQDPIDVLLGKN